MANDLVREGQLGLPEAFDDRGALRFVAERSPEAQAKMTSLVRVLRAAEHVVTTKTRAGEPQELAGPLCRTLGAPRRLRRCM